LCLTLSDILLSYLFLHLYRCPLRTTLFPYTTLFRSCGNASARWRNAPTRSSPCRAGSAPWRRCSRCGPRPLSDSTTSRWSSTTRSEEHTSELQSRFVLVCRLLLEIKKINQ